MKEPFSTEKYLEKCRERMAHLTGMNFEVRKVTVIRRGEETKALRLVTEDAPNSKQNAAIKNLIAAKCFILELPHENDNNEDIMFVAHKVRLMRLGNAL